MSYPFTDDQLAAWELAKDRHEQQLAKGIKIFTVWRVFNELLGINHGVLAELALTVFKQDNPLALDIENGTFVNLERALNSALEAQKATIKGD